MLYSDRLKKIIEDIEALCHELDVESMDREKELLETRCDFEDISAEIQNGRYYEAIDYLKEYEL